MNVVLPTSVCNTTWADDTRIRRRKGGFEDFARGIGELDMSAGDLPPTERRVVTLADQHRIHQGCAPVLA